MKKDLNSLYLKLKKAGMSSEANKILRIIKTSTIEDKRVDDEYNSQELNPMELLSGLDKKEFERRVLRRDIKDVSEDFRENINKEKEEREKKKKDREKVQFEFPASSMDTPESFALESDDEHVGIYEDSLSAEDRYNPDMNPMKGKDYRDLARSLKKERSDFKSEELSEMKRGLKNMLRKRLPATGNLKGEGSSYDVDAKTYYNFLQRELGENISNLGLVSLDGTATINLNVIADTLTEKYSKLSQARKRNMINAMVKRGFLKR